MRIGQPRCEINWRLSPQSECTTSDCYRSSAPGGSTQRAVLALDCCQKIPQRGVREGYGIRGWSGDTWNGRFCVHHSKRDCERKEVQGSKRGERTKETTDGSGRGVRDGKLPRDGDKTHKVNAGVAFTLCVDICRSLVCWSGMLLRSCRDVLKRSLLCSVVAGELVEITLLEHLAVSVEY